MDDPFDLSKNRAYSHWRALKLRAYPCKIQDLHVHIGRLDRPSQAELAALKARIDTFNMALVEVDPDGIETEALLSFTRALGLRRTDANLFADASAFSRIAAARADPDDEAPVGSGHSLLGRATLGDFVPYTNKPLSWHTDGYYNTPDQQVGAWCLFCVRAARDGGENGLLDHEMAYLQLRDESPQHIAALSHPQALSIPAHVHDGRTLRAASVGPVFSVRNGQLHMRYSARARHVLWRDTPDTHAARAALDRLFSRTDVFTFRYRLRPGEGLISNNVLHCRAGFGDDEDPAKARLLYRIRFLDRIALD
ncbi:TauD/TfdA family dioxygenase [Thiocapsa roseopersicina]|uniref:Taurine catabolism dioxygenase TauD, TfdA family n=1 Tax=Thiocapsa roseopersicina TaxID=1058 RepID=A0A1H2RJR0_THIRO|nr:TauD/TfdA family dioxygenase [Thiocapsa roseopersicina]SDW19706.1 Taurine catabolism dioxygenase TauD, TfdA family [Thiocapsa roseopersicina]